MKHMSWVIALAIALGTASCRIHHVITVTDPIVVEIVVKVDQELDNYFSDIDE
jgi:hypothetical protein